MRWVRAESANEPALEDVVTALKAGEIVIIPTDTVYGLAALAHSAEALQRVFIAKGRSENKPLIVGVANLDQLQTVVFSFPESAQKLAKEFWPGPLSLVLPKHDSIPEMVAAGGKTVAVRIPNNPIALAILEKTGPLVLTSANLSGNEELPNTAEAAVEQVGLQCSFVVDAGPSPTNIASTVVDLTAVPPTVLREGAIPAQRIFEALTDQRQ